MHRSLSCLIALAALALLGADFREGIEEGVPRDMDVDSRLPGFVPQATIEKGRLSSAGSDSLNNLLTLWGQSLLQHHPQWQFEVWGKGSATAQGALISRRVDVGQMTRLWKPSEIDVLKDQFGYEPISLRVAPDILGVFVHTVRAGASRAVACPG